MSHLGRCEKWILQNFEMYTKIWWQHVYKDVGDRC